MKTRKKMIGDDLYHHLYSMKSGFVFICHIHALLKYTTQLL